MLPDARRRRAHLPPALASLILLAAAARAQDSQSAARITGRVLDAAGKRVAQARIHALEWSPRFGIRIDGDGVNGSRSESSRSGGDGAFEAPTAGLAGHAVMVLAVAPSGGMALAGPMGRSQAGLELRTGPGLRITGVVSDASGAPVAGTTVTCIVDLIPGVVRRSARSADDGSYTIDGLPYEPHRLTTDGIAILASRDGFATARRSAAWAQEGPVSESGDRTWSLPITLTRGGTVSGTVRDATSGKPVPNATVLAWGSAWRVDQSDFDFGPDGFDRIVLACTKSEADGTYRLTHLPIDERRHRFSGEHGWLHAIQRGNTRHFDGGVLVDATGHDPAMFELARPSWDGQKLAQDFALQPQSVLAGRVTDDQGHPAAGVRVHVRPAERTTVDWVRFDRGSGDQVSSRLTDGNGRYELAGLPSIAPSGTAVVVWANRDGFACRGETVVVASGQITKAPDVVLEDLDPLRTFRGVVKDAGGKPIAGAVVSWIAAESEDFIWSGAGYREATDEQGRFRLVESRPGLRVHATAHGYARTISAAPAEAAEASIVLEPVVPFAGRVVDADGKPVPLCAVLVQSQSPKLYRWLDSDGSGRILWEDLPRSLAATLLFAPPPRAGSPRQIQDGWHRIMGPRVESIDGPDPAAEYRLDWTPSPSGCRVTIRVLDAETGEPVREPIDGTLHLDRKAVPRTEAAEDIHKAVRSVCQYGSGLARVDGVPPGAHTFWLTVPGYRAFKEGKVRVVAGAAAKDVEVRLQRGMILQGLARRAAATAACGVLVVSAVTEESADDILECCPDAEGAFRLPLPWLGHDVQATVRDAAGLPLEQSPLVRLPAGDRRFESLELELRPAVRLTIKLDEAIDEKCRFASIRVMDAEKRLWFERAALKASIWFGCRLDHHFDIGVPAGEYDIQVLSGIRSEQKVVKSVRARAPGLVELSLP